MTDPRYITTPPVEVIERLGVDQILDEAHQAAFDTALSNVLSTTTAEITFAQILDGFPLKEVAFGNEGHGHTIRDLVCKHETICPGTMDRVTQFRESFESRKLDMEVEALRRFQGVPADSRASHLPLFELTASAIHRIAVLLFQLDDTCHKGQNAHDGRPESLKDFPLYPTPFTLCFYRFVEQYPDGVADLAGYWAEDQIFGGVVLFEHVDGNDQYKDVWFHSHRKNITTRPYSLTEDHKTSLLHFLRSNQSTDSVLPILGNKTNLRRVDAEIAIPEHGIYRDRWERKIERYDYSDYLRRRRDVIDVIDFPELANPRMFDS
ncbi:unnamed protein product [Discula destructiva]